jgi:hypothetical protein
MDQMSMEMPQHLPLRYVYPIAVFYHLGKGGVREWYEAVAMDYLINARERGLCLHKVTEEYFGNDKIGNCFHHLCFVA